MRGEGEIRSSETTGGASVRTPASLWQPLSAGSGEEEEKMSFHARSIAELGRLFVDLTERLQTQGIPAALEMMRQSFAAELAVLTSDCRHGHRAPLTESVIAPASESAQGMLSGALESRHLVVNWQDEASVMRYGLRLMRRVDQAEFDADESALAENLLMQLARGIESNQSRRNADIEHALYSGMIERLQIGMIVLDRAGRVLSSSSRAKELLTYRDGLHLVAGRLYATAAAEDRKFQEMLRAALSDAMRGITGPGRGLSLTKRGAMRKMGVILRPLALNDGQDNAAVSISIRDADVAPDVGPVMMRQIFDLTPAEAAVAGRLTEGLSLEDTALALEISHNTARAHLRSIFSKSGINRQTELVRLVLNSAVVL